MNEDLQTYIEPELEARIVALVLGEASAFEAEELERLISEKPELKAYRSGLEKIHGVVTEAHEEQHDAEWKLSEDRRGKILAKIEERKRSERVEARRKRISGIAQRRLIYTCAACLVLTLVILVLSEPFGLEEDEATAMAYSSEAPMSRRASLADLDEAILEQSDKVQNHRNELASIVQDYGIPYFDGGSSETLGMTEQEMFAKARQNLSRFEGESEKLQKEIRQKVQDGEPGEEAEVLGTKLELAERQISRMREMVDNRKEDSIALSLNQGHYNQAKEEYEQSREVLREMEQKRSEMVAGGVTRFAPEAGKETLAGEDPSDGMDSEKLDRFLSGNREQEGRISHALEALDEALTAKTLEPGMSPEHVGSLEDPSRKLGESAEWGKNRKLSEREVAEKPSAPTSSASRAVAANTSTPEAIPVPAVEAPDPMTDFGDGDNFGEGWGAGGGGATGGVVTDSAVVSRPDSVKLGDAMEDFEIQNGEAPWDFELTDVNDRGSSSADDSFEFEKEESEALIRGLRSANQAKLASGGEGGRKAGEEDRKARTRDDGRGGQTLNQPSLTLRNKTSTATPIPNESSEEIKGKQIAGKDKSEPAARSAKPEGQIELKVDGLVAPNDGQNPSGLSKSLSGLERASGANEAEDSSLGMQPPGSGLVSEAQQSLPEEEVEKANPDHLAAKRGLEYLDDPIPTEARFTDGHTEEVDKVRRNLYKGESYYNLGLYDKAEEEFKKTLRIDPYNKDVRRWMERSAAIKSDYYRAAYDQTRAEMLMEVDKAWDLAVPPLDEDGDAVEVSDPFSTGGGNGSDNPFAVESGRRSNNFFGTSGGDPDPFSADEKGEMSDPFAGEDPDEEAAPQLSLAEAQLIPRYGEVSDEEAQTSAHLKRLNQIIIPEVNLDDVTVEEAVKFIEAQTRELESTSGDGAQSGIEIRVRTPKTLPFDDEDGFGDEVDPADSKIKNLELRNVPARIALQYIADEAKLRYKIDADGVTLLPITDGEDADLKQRRWEISPEVAKEIRGATSNGKSFTTILKEQGVSFPPNASASFLDEDNILIVRNTPTNLELLNGIVEAAERFAKEKVRAREAEWLLGEVTDTKAEAAKTEVISPKSKPTTPTKPPTVAPFETSTKEKTDSTFSLNVSDVSFKLAKAALSQGNWPDASKVRPGEFVNALAYDDPKPTQAEKIACEIEQGSHPFMQQRNLMRVSMSTASLGRNAATPLRLTILLDQSGSMERADRAESVKRAFALLAAQLNPNDEVTLVGFARTPRLLAERVKGNEVARLAGFVANPLTEGGTNLEEALSTGLQLAKQQFLKGAQNRIILLTDGAANLGDAKPKNLASQVESMRRADIAFDACGVGADGLNDDVLSSLTKQGDGRYYFLDRPEDADEGFARQIAGALRPAAKNVKVQVLFNPERVASFKLYGFEKHKLKKEDFRNDSVDAAEMAAEESGVALYHFEPMPEGRGEIGTVSVRFLDTASNQMVERTWSIPYQEEAKFFSEAEPTLRLASVAALFAEKLKGSPVGDRVELKRLRQETQLLKPTFAKQTRFQEFQTMLQQAGE